MLKQTVTAVNNTLTYPLNNETLFSGNGYEVALRDAYFIKGGETIFRPTANIIGFLLEKNCQLTLRSLNNSSVENNNDIQGVHFLPANQPVYLRWTQGRHRFIYYQFDYKELLGKLMPDATTAIRRSASTNILSPFITAGMLRLAHILSSKKDIAAAHVDLIIKTLTMEILTQSSEQLGHDSHPDKNDCHPLDIASLQAFVDNFDGVPKIDMIAEHFKLSPRKLSFYYHKKTGQTLRTYLAETRIKKAECLLLGTDMMIKQVGYACSFSSPASFNGAFVAARGVSPAAYRKRARL